ncbi:hypothetical protein JL720_4493 [Aureococcus anophagefferens]|nr:hypothetical protein JL720_4493 [Aureococcus anophagefferens]
MGSAHWSGWQTICDMLHDPKPSNRASAVQTLRSLTHDGDEGDARWREGEKVERVSRREVAPAWGEPGRGAWAWGEATRELRAAGATSPHASWRSAPDDDGHQRRRVVRAVRAADVLRNAISSTARDDANDHEIFVPDVLDVVDDREQVREAPRVEKPEDAPRRRRRRRQRRPRERFEPPRVDDDVADDDEGDDGDFNRRRRNLAAMAAMRNLDAGVDEDALSHNGDDVLPRLQALRDAGGVDAVVDLLADRDEWGQAGARAGQESEIPNFKGSFLGRFPLAGAALTLRALVRAGDQGGAAKTPLDTVEEASEEDCVEAPPPVADEAPVEGRCAASSRASAVPRLVSMLSRGRERPQAAVQAAGALVALVGDPGRCRCRSPPPAPNRRDRSASRSPSPAQLKAQLKDAIDADRSVIQTIVDLLQDMVRAEGEGFAAAHDLAETLRTIASSDLVAHAHPRRGRRFDGARRGRGPHGGRAARPGLARQRRARRRARPGPSEAEDDAGAAEEAAEAAGRRRQRAAAARAARAADDIVVRQGLPAYELGLHSRITSHPSGFRRWHVTHELVANSRRRVRGGARRAAHRAARGLLRQEKVDLVDMIRGATVAGATSGLAQRSDDQRVSGLASRARLEEELRRGPRAVALETRGAGRDERERVAVAGYGKAAETPRRHRHGGTTPGLVQYDVVQSDLRSLKLLQRRVRLETAAHETATHADEEVDPAAGDREGDLTTELHLLDSTLSALGEMRDVS